MNAGFSQLARRWGLLVAGAVLVTSLFPALAPAQSASAAVPVTGGSWYWQEQVGTVEPGSGLPPVAPPGALPTPDVPAGDFPVAVVGGQPDKETFLQLDSSAITQGSTVTRLVLTLVEDPAASGKLNPETAAIEARAVSSFMSAGAQGAAWKGRPDIDTNGPAAPGKRALDGTWTFDLTALAQRWASGEFANNGLALIPAAPASGQSYEVVWLGIGTAKPPVTSGSITPALPASTGNDSGAQAPPADSTPAPLSIAPDTSGAGVTASDTPSVATGSSTPAAAAPSALAAPSATRVRQISSAHRAPPWSFYLAIVAALALIGASTLSLGELGEPEPDRRGGVLRALERHGQEIET